MMIPKPFTTALVRVAGFMYVSPNADDDEMKRAHEALQAALDRVRIFAEANVSQRRYAGVSLVHLRNSSENFKPFNQSARLTSRLAASRFSEPVFRIFQIFMVGASFVSHNEAQGSGCNSRAAAQL